MKDYNAEREAHPTPLEFTISTRVPSKWVLIDDETGDMWTLVEQDGKLAARNVITREDQRRLESKP